MSRMAFIIPVLVLSGQNIRYNECGVKTDYKLIVIKARL